MEKKAANNSITSTTTTTTTAKPLGSMCEKLFNAINTNNTFRPLRLLTNRQQEPAAPQSGTLTQSNNLSATTAATTGAKHNVPSPPPPPQEKPKVAFTPSSIGKNDVKGTDRKDAPHVAKKDPKGNTTAHNPVPVPVPPKGAIVPHPAPPAGVASSDTTDTKPKKSLNEKIDEYINRTKVKLRSHSTVGRTSTTK